MLKEHPELILVNRDGIGDTDDTIKSQNTYINSSVDLNLIKKKLQY